ncbi:MAG: UvrD-helicase domain-containing protein [bacterium]
MRTAEIIDPGRNVALKASAGSGKTFALSLRVINLLLHGVHPENILCITFTNKATNEMYQRVISLLRSLAFELSPGNISNEAKYLLLAERGEETLRELSAYSFSDDEVIRLRERSRAIYDQVVRSLSRLRISTIDSFLNTILRLFPFEAGVRPDFRILTPEIHDRLYQDAFDHFIRSLDDDPKLRHVMAELIKLSYQAVNSPATFLAPYFSRLLEMRIGAERIIRAKLACVEEGEGDRCISDITTDLKRIGDLDISIRKEARSFAGELKTQCPDLSTPGRNELKRYETSDAGGIAGLTSITKDAYDEYTYFRRCCHDRRAQGIFEKIKKDLPLFVTHRNRSYRDAILYLFSLFASALDRLKRSGNGLSFPDVTNTCYRFLVDHGMLHQDADYFYFRLDSRIEHLLIDEFQDTNFVQWLILKPFVDELTAGVGQHDRQGSFFYVGDPKQSIYRFRGGESRLFDNVLDQYQGKILSETLSSNYRSSRQVVEFVNTLFSGIAERYPFDYEPQEGKRGESEGCVEVVFFSRDDAKQDPDMKKKQVLAWMRRLLGSGTGPGAVAILCSDNRECETYAESLAVEGIPAVTEGSLSFLSSPGVGAVLEMLRYLNDPSQSVYLLNFLFSVPGLLSEQKKLALLSLNRDHALPEDTRGKIERILNRVNLLPVAHVIRMIVDEFGLFSSFGRDPNMILLMDRASSPELEDPVSLGVFLEFVEMTLRDVKAVQAESVNAVKVLTIHKAKGLEFPFVIVPELEIDISVNANNTRLIFSYDANLLVDDICLNENEKMLRFHEELSRAVEREQALVLRDRLNQLYVALTRAGEGLFVAAVAGDQECRRERILKLSNILAEVLGEQGYRSGSLPAAGPEPRPEITAHERQRAGLDDVLAFIEKKKQKPSPAEEKEEILETRSFENFRARRLGVAFHAAVQTMNSFDRKAADEALGWMKESFGAELSSQELESIRSRLRLLVDNPRFLMMTEGVERNHEITFLQGRKVSVPDLLLIGKDEIKIIDFKTSYENELLERYRRQVLGYCALASRIFRLPCKGYLCFVLEDNIRYQEVS